MDTITDTPLQPLLCTLREAAILLNTSVDTLRRRIVAGELAAVRIGSRGKLMVERHELDALIERCRVPAGAAP